MTDMFAELRRLHDRIRCAEIAREEARRTVLVPGPASAVKLEAWLIAHGLDDIITVEMSQFLPPDTWIVMDVQAIEAGTAEAIQEMSRQPLLLSVKSCPRCGWEVGTGHSPRCIVGMYAFTAATVREPLSWIKVTGA
jgi:hypothetical protein